MAAKFYQMCFGTLGGVLWFFCFHIGVDCCIGNPNECPSQYSHPCVVLHVTSANWTLASMLQLELAQWNWSSWELPLGSQALCYNKAETMAWWVSILQAQLNSHSHMRASTAPWETEPPLWAQTTESQATLHCYLFKPQVLRLFVSINR